jgi:penicillin V acylase-like amidase (Ntn superfamily)
MIRKHGCNLISVVISSLLMGLTFINNTYACTRALLQGSDNTVMTGRSMDWEEDMMTDLWIMPQGIVRQGEAGPNSPTWTAKYGSVVASVYNLATADGMNEKGLVMNMLYLAESNYGADNGKQPTLSVSLWGQYALDNYATVNEAASALTANPFLIKAPNLPNGTASTVHLSLSDPTGDSAIFEYVAGKLVVHHDKKYQVMTNSPTFSKQLALNDYWQTIGGNVFLPGTSRAADRFARASFYLSAVPTKIAHQFIKSVPDSSFSHQAVAEVLSIMRAVSVPLGISTPNEPNIASTLWRTVSDQKNLIYYFDSSTRPNTFWVDLHKIDFKTGSSVRRLDLQNGKIYAGETSHAFKTAKAFEFLSASN